MESWISLWKAVFIISVSAFAIMAVWVTIAGAFDIKSLLKTLKDEQDARSSNQD
jgi:hypothetical protein